MQGWCIAADIKYTAQETVFCRRTHHSFRFVHSSTTKKGQGALLLLLLWSFPVFSVAYHKHAHLFYGVVLTAFLRGESSSTIRSWALCGLRLTLLLKNSEHVGNGSMMIFRMLKFQFSLILYWDRQCARLCVAACLSGITNVSHFHMLLSGQTHPEDGLWKLPQEI